MTHRISFQGELGAYGHEACLNARPGAAVVPCPSFEEAIAAVTGGRADEAMLPVENSTYGRVADIHRLLPQSGLHIVDEAFVRVRIALMAPKGVPLENLREARGHPVILPQCGQFLSNHNIKGVAATDNAKAAADLAKSGDTDAAALASALAAQIYGLNILADGIEDHANNTTRFLVMSPNANLAQRATQMKTTFVFQVRNIPAALYKAMGGFATNGVNMAKLESYMVGGTFTATQFYADIDGHPDDTHVRLALEELDFFTDEVKILGTYPSQTPTVK